ncbi:UvrD-helicase domain-containing protein [Trichocoleus sp. FACHB-40]|uniref:UvrD-helicase domain-containing protein n=2 Tax=Cyanophyceae TaxID=3028117 RepID=UPI0018EFB6E1|nr:UvrD-helicase domain-containing protein [Trichocoleus sp. FACHB-40]
MVDTIPYEEAGKYTIRYPKERFIREFDSIAPPLSCREIFEFIQKGRIDIEDDIGLQLEKQRQERTRLEQLEKQRQEHTRLEQQHRERERLRLEAERKEKECQQRRERERLRLEAERKEKERREQQRREQERLHQEQKRLRLEVERKEKERKLEEERQQRVRREVEKQTLLNSLKEQFAQDFLNAHNFYQAQCIEHISFEEYQSEKINYVRYWVQHHLNSTPDSEQAAAIGAVESHVQVVARAGSGKTSTLVNRALFLQKHCGVAPDEMLLLAFNRKAAEEIRERLTKQLQGSIPHVMTFHALAYALVHPEESILLDEPNGEQSKSRALQSVIDDYLRDPNYREEIRVLMMAHFREDWERIASGGYDKSPEEMLRYRRSLPREGLDGTYLKSFGEKVIADFLFEHNIKYKYERNFWWNGINYRPDFTIFTGDNQGIVIEYFGLEGDPDYDAMSAKKRQYWQNNSNWRLLELSPSSLKHEGVEGFCTLLKHSIEDFGITCARLSEEEIWLRIKDRAIDRFTKAVVGFIQRCRKLSLTSEKLARIVEAHSCANSIEEHFLGLAERFYKSYLERLQATGEEDFDGLMQRAAQIVASGETVFRRKSGTGDLNHLRYVFIDEYQDFSELFHNLIESVREQNPQALFFCVGDDWQAINGFAGSNLRFYKNFAQFFQPSRKLNIATNYRSATSIVDMGNTLMQGLGTPARVHKSILGKVEIADLGTFQPTQKESEEHSGDILTPVVLRLVNKAIKEDKNIVLLSRKNSLPWYVNHGESRSNSRDGTLDSFLQQVRSYLPENLRYKVTISTSHKYKGLEKKVVIILDAVPRCYPLLHPDLMLSRVFGDSIQQVFDEERRLFYVALTRAVEHLFILTETNNVSPFLEELRNRKTISSVNWSDYQSLVGAIKHLTIKVGNQDGRGGNGTYAIRDLLKAEGYNWNSRLKAWCRTYPAQNFSLQQFFDNAEWSSRAVGIEVRFYDDFEKMLAIYRVDKGQWTCVVDKILNLEFDDILF